MGAFHVFQIVQMVPNRTTHHIFTFLQLRSNNTDLWQEYEDKIIKKYEAKLKAC